MANNKFGTRLAQAGYVATHTEEGNLYPLQLRQAMRAQEIAAAQAVRTMVRNATRLKDSRGE